MSIIKRVLSFMMMTVIGLTSCGNIENYISSPPPGWNQDVKNLFVEESAFPTGWQAMLELEVDDYPQNNHVHREFGQANMSGIVSQDIWRAYTERDAQRKFDDLIESQFVPKQPLPSWDFYLPFEPPSEITFQSEFADEFYLACGWWTIAYCQVVARYKNYVVYLRLDHKRDYGEYHSEGLNYQQMEKIIKAMDAKMEKVLQSYK